MKTGIVVFAHGSSVAEANEAVHAVARQFSRAGGYDRVEVGFLDVTPPTLADAVATLAGEGVTRVVIIPYFLTLGIHLQRDMPRIIDELRGIHTHVRIDVTPPLDGHPALLEILLDRAREGV